MTLQSPFITILLNVFRAKSELLFIARVSLIAMFRDISQHVGYLHPLLFQTRICHPDRPK